MSRFMKIFIILILVLVIPSSVFSKNICTSNNEGYVMGYFNGIWTTKLQAEDELSALRDTFYGSSYKGEVLNYELLYNQTGMDKDGTTMLEDLAEVFAQRADEAGSVLKNRWEIFWETLGDSPKPKKSRHRSFFGKIVDKISSVSKAFKNLISSFVNAVLTKVTTFITGLMGNPPTDIDYTTHHTRLKTLYFEGKKLLLIAESQGNLFANKAYDNLISSGAKSENVKVVHVAPASVKTSGEHTLANIDLVINALRLQGFSSVPNINVEIPASHLKTDDYTGHMLINTYLNPKRDAVIRVGEQVKDALDKLINPDTNANGGFFSATLTWDGKGDLDINLYEPDGTQVTHQNNSKTNSGIIDIDNTQAYGPEHYIATCNSDNLKDGIYQIGFNHYSDAEGRTGTIQIASDERGVIYTKSFSTGEATRSEGIADPIPIVNVRVDKDEDGKFSIDIE